MVVDFPIRIDFNNALFGSVLASLPHKPEFAAMAAAQLGRDTGAIMGLQENLYHRTVDQLRRVRQVLGHAQEDDLYSLPWFLVGFHGWMAIAELRGIPKTGWLRGNDDLSMLQRSFFELGVGCEPQQLREHLGNLIAAGEPGASDRKADIDSLKLLEGARYLSSAAVRRGHRVGLHVPARSTFVSYAHKDRQYVDDLVTFLEAHAVKAWYDTSDLKSGTKLEERLRSEIDKVECLVAVLTENSIHSDYVALEIAAAIDMGKDLLPLSLVPLDELKQLQHPQGRDLHAQIMRYVVVDASASTPIEAYEDVLRTLQRAGDDLTRWRLDEGSHLSLFSRMLQGTR